MAIDSPNQPFINTKNFKKQVISYNQGTETDKNWIVTETAFHPEYQGKCEAIFCQGNGYMGIRCSTEEAYVGQVRNTFIAGSFNKFDAYEVTELPNAADHMGMKILIDGRRLDLSTGKVDNYFRRLNLRMGEVIRQFTWTNINGKQFECRFRRFVSLKRLHTFGTSVSIKCLDSPAKIEIISGIDGQQTNTGAQHFHEGNKRIYDRTHLQLLATTTESKITFVHNASHKVVIDGGQESISSRFAMDRRSLFMVYQVTPEAGQTLQLEKISNIYTTRDKEMANKSVEQIQEYSLTQLKESLAMGYDKLQEESALHWATKWQQTDIRVNSSNDLDQLAVGFALYHLTVMTPTHDSRMGIPAKGLSGEGYKGHSFWDTELFLLPFFTFSRPETARNLLEYRYHTLPGARKKAAENGYKGAMYPWESAWMDDGEVTPVWGAADIVTGKSTKIWSGFIEQHITSDVAFAVWQYSQVTGDEDFMEKYGYEILLDTGIFWASRLEWDENRQLYTINDVVGPDEYKEHVDNDAFTNYTAKWCIQNAIDYYYFLRDERPDVFVRLNTKLSLDKAVKEMEARVDQVLLHPPNEDLIIPQNDTFLQLQEIDLTKYKQQEHVGSIFLDYNLEQINQIQVCKQADVVILLYLLEHLFPKEVKAANFKYYEARTLHDSSLSLSSHAILAADLGDLELSYELFRKAAAIDLGPNMKSSDHGIHAASIGGIWQMIVCGFGGVRMVGGRLRIEPTLPTAIQQLSFPIIWQGNRLQLTIGKNGYSIENQGMEPVLFEFKEQERQVLPGATLTL